MSNSAIDSLTLDAAAATEMLESGANKAHLIELDQRISAITADLRNEQEAGYATLEKNLRAWTVSHLRREDVEGSIRLAERVREQFAVFILVGIGGSDLGGAHLQANPRQ